MHSFLLKRYAEKTALWIGLGVLNAPLAFVPALLARLARGKGPAHKIMESIPEFRYARNLPASDPVAAIAHGMSAKANVHFSGIFLQPDTSFKNACLLCERNDDAILFFQGYPLDSAELFASPQKESVVRGIIAHELGHTMTRGTTMFSNNAKITALLYAAGTFCAGIGAAGNLLFGNFLTSATAVGLCALSAGATVATLVLGGKNHRNDEHLADLHGAQLFGADDVITAHDFGRKIMLVDKGFEKTPEASAYKPTAIERFVKKHILNTHPSSEERIAALRAVFNCHAAQYTPVNPPAPAFAPAARPNQPPMPE